MRNQVDPGEKTNQKTLAAKLHLEESVDLRLETPLNKQQCPLSKKSRCHLMPFRGMMVGGIRTKRKKIKKGTQTLIWGAVENSGRADLAVVCCVVYERMRECDGGSWNCHLFQSCLVCFLFLFFEFVGRPLMSSRGTALPSTGCFGEDLTAGPDRMRGNRLCRARQWMGKVERATDMPVRLTNVTGWRTVP